MLRRLVVVAVLIFCGIAGSLAQAPGDPTPQGPPETPPPPQAVGGESSPPHRPPIVETDAVVALGEARGAVRLAPDDPALRLALARALYHMGDLEAAGEECRGAIKLQPDDAKAHLQLGIVLMARQDWRAAASVLHEAIRLDPGLAEAHYSLGSVHYSLGKLKAAQQSYRQALTLQPYFPDARYRLALLLKLSKQEQEAAALLEEAALGGIPQAQFFLGNAYRNGQGLEKDPAKAVFWWTKAAEYGYQPSVDVLGRLRRQALSSDQTDSARKEAQDAFLGYRRRLWEEFGEYAPTDGEEAIGVKLLKDRRTDVAVPTLLREGYALSTAAQLELARLYDSGWENVLPPHDKHILACFEVTAAEGFFPAKRALARIYGKGIGLPANLPKAKAVLRGLPKHEAEALLTEIGAR